MRRWLPLTGSSGEAPVTVPASASSMPANPAPVIPAVTIPALVAVGLMVAAATSQAGYPLTQWAPGGLATIALVAIAGLAVPVKLAQIEWPMKLALGCLALYTVLSFCSIAWAGVPGDAWEGANRTLLYLLVFALFALWRQRGASAALLVAVWALAMVGVAAYVALRVDSAGGAAFRGLFAYERLLYPAGYANASAAQWGMAFWPSLLLARARLLPSALRGLLAGGAVLLADVALLSLSRGGVLSMAVMLVLVFALVPERLRTFATCVPVAAALGLTVPLVLRVGDRIKAGQSPYAATHVAVAAIFAAAAAVAVVVAVGAAIENRGSLSPRLARRGRRALAVAAWACAVAVVAGGLVAAGDPVARARSAWHSFKSGYSSGESRTRLLSGLGSNRYDFYRVSLDQFLAHPAVGIAADNFAQQYLVHGRSDETPRYPHSVELRTLVQTGAVGGVLAVVGLAGALAAGWRAMRRRTDPLRAAVAAAALSGFGYWAVHGSFDWFWEFAGLGAPAFALLGVACSLAPHRMPGAGPSAGAGAGPPPAARAAPAARRRRGTRIALAVAMAALALGAAYSFAAPWLSERQIQSAARIWPRAPLAAYARLNDAAGLNPLSDRPYLVAGAIAVRFGDLARAEDEFSRALRRVPNGAYATLELGAIASASGDRARALRLLRRAVSLAPRDKLFGEALAVAAHSRRLSLTALDRAILGRAQRLK